MSTFDRSKFKATNLSTLKEQDTQVEEMGLKNDFGKNNRPDYLKIPEGTSKWRIFPAQEAERPFLYMKVVSWLPQEVYVNKEGKEVRNPKPEDTQFLKLVNKRKPIFNGRVHGSYEKDLVEEYIKFFKNLVFEELDVNSAKEKMKVLQNFQTGIMPKIAWVCYAQKLNKDGTKDFGRLEMSPSLKDYLSKISNTEDPDQPIQTDPFTDPDEGKAVLITFNKEAEPAKKYSAAIEFRGNYSLTDAELVKLDDFDKLWEVVGDSIYKRGDFDRTLVGLEMFDTENKLGVFQYDTWLDICEEISNMIPEDAIEEEAGNAVTKTAPMKEIKADKTKAPIPYQKPKSVTKPMAVEKKPLFNDEGDLQDEDEESSQEDEDEEEEQPKSTKRSPIDDVLDSRPTAKGVKIEETLNKGTGMSFKDRLAAKNKV